MTARRVLVTGASRGIGAALVEKFLAAGDRVFGCGRTTDAPAHERYRHFALDVGDADAVREMFRAIRKDAGGLDILVNNAGIARMNVVALTPADDARRVLETNVLGTFFCTTQAIRLLRQSTAPRIINLSTVAVPLRLEGEAIYAASKAAVEMLTRVTAKEVGGWGITCNAVGPSPIKTRLTANVPEATIEKLVQRQPRPGWATADDVYNVVEFFARPESGMVTGQVVYLGGFS
ncbi:MAG: SDR family oxidoreductase [Vicinamibacterales bacterium]